MLSDDFRGIVILSEEEGALFHIALMEGDMTKNLDHMASMVGIGDRFLGSKDNDCLFEYLDYLLWLEGPDVNSVELKLILIELKHIFNHEFREFGHQFHHWFTLESILFFGVTSPYLQQMEIGFEVSEDFSDESHISEN